MQTNRYGQTQLANQWVYGPDKRTGANNTAGFQVAVQRSPADARLQFGVFQG